MLNIGILAYKIIYIIRTDINRHLILTSAPEIVFIIFKYKLVKKKK